MTPARPAEAGHYVSSPMAHAASAFRPTYVVSAFRRTLSKL
jgi:hypothetical protein